MTIRKMNEQDWKKALALWQQSSEAGEVVLKPITFEQYHSIFRENPNYDGSFDFIAEEDGNTAGFISGCIKHEFLPNETHENTPGYITCFFVAPEYRKRGIGKALLNKLESEMLACGKKSLQSSSLNPINLAWFVPGTPGHDHNNAPGTDIECMGYQFLCANGYEDMHREVAMYLNLDEYKKGDFVEETRARLKSEGIYAGLYDTGLNYEFDRMCDNVGSEYWRKVLQEETAKKNPRPILVGAYEGHIVGFTGPVDRQASGRGFFTGICTDPNFEKRGIATVIFNDLMCEFKKVGAEFSTLFTGVDNHAQRLYLKTGFRPARTFAIMKKDLQ